MITNRNEYRNSGFRLSSGNRTVDQMGTVHFSGNVTPQIWYKTILRESGKPHLLAITLLSDIVYWYRPVEVRDEASGAVIGWRKRFKGEFLQKTYQQYADLYGESKRSIKAALDLLEELQVIRKIFRDVPYENGIILYNLMYIDLNVNALFDLTFPEEKSEETEQEQISQAEYAYPPTTKCTTPLQQNVPPPTTNGDTNTENTTENTTEITFSDYPINQSDTKNPCSDWMDTIDDIHKVNAYIRIIKRNIDYETFVEHGDWSERALFEELFEVICDVVCGKGDVLRIAGNEYPYELVRAKFLKLNSSHLKYVILCMKNTTTHISNIKSYMLTALYNAPNTINHYFQQRVQHDMSTGGTTNEEDAV